ncbi:MAG: phosphotransferase [Actinomycetota bacterium]|nr:phosphotransferase [Actinomycetota bacterium]
MNARDVRRAVAAATSVAAARDMAVDDAVVLSDSNRLVVRLTPCDGGARVAPESHFASSELEVALVSRLVRTGSPAAGLDPRFVPRVVVRDGFEIAMWTHFEPVPERAVPPAEYASALGRLHVGLRQVDIAAPHVMDRVAAVQRDVANRDITPDLADADRVLLADSLRDVRGSIVDRRAPEQLLHGEPHPWNLLDTSEGLLFIDFENTARGPVEYDLAWVPDAVTTHYPGLDRELLDECRGLVLAIIAVHRWRRDDQHPSGRRSGVAFLDALRHGPPWPALDEVVW